MGGQKNVLSGQRDQLNSLMGHINPLDCPQRAEAEQGTEMLLIIRQTVYKRCYPKSGFCVQQMKALLPKAHFVPGQ